MGDDRRESRPQLVQLPFVFERAAHGLLGSKLLGPIRHRGNHLRTFSGHAGEMDGTGNLASVGAAVNPIKKRFLPAQRTGDFLTRRFRAEASVRLAFRTEIRRPSGQKRSAVHTVEFQRALIRFDKPLRRDVHHHGGCRGMPITNRYRSWLSRNADSVLWRSSISTASAIHWAT